VTGEINGNIKFRVQALGCRPILLVTLSLACSLIRLVLLTSNLAYCCDRWNPAVEQQAQDRIHRLGQYKPIHVTRFVIAGSIEERILKLQV